VIEGEGAHESRLTHTAQSFEENPVWSPDGQKIAFTTPEDRALHVMNANGTNKDQLAVDLLSSVIPSWSPDGGKIAFTTGEDGFSNELSVINVDGTHKVRLITAAFSGNSEDRIQLGNPVWSPTDNKIAFASRTVTDTHASSSAEPASIPAEGLAGIYLINADGTGYAS
jgi:tricorn protease